MRRVQRALVAAGVETEILHLSEGTRTAVDAARAAGCEVDQIAKSIVFLGLNSEKAVLFITAGGNQVSDSAAAILAGEPIGKADASVIREQTGFSIGGVSPIGLTNPVSAFFDARLLDFDQVWAAAGTPNHIFAIQPSRLLEISGASVASFT